MFDKKAQVLRMGMSAVRLMLIPRDLGSISPRRAVVNPREKRACLLRLITFLWRRPLSRKQPIEHVDRASVVPGECGLVGALFI